MPLLFVVFVLPIFCMQYTLYIQYCWQPFFLALTYKKFSRQLNYADMPIAASHGSDWLATFARRENKLNYGLQVNTMCASIYIYVCVCVKASMQFAENNLESTNERAINGSKTVTHHAGGRTNAGAQWNEKQLLRRELDIQCQIVANNMWNRKIFSFGTEAEFICFKLHEFSYILTYIYVVIICQV